MPAALVGASGRPLNFTGRAQEIPWCYVLTAVLLIAAPERSSSHMAPGSNHSCSSEPKRVHCARAETEELSY